MIELYNNFSDVLEETLFPQRSDIVKCLIEKYNAPGMATYVGSFLRLFTKTPVICIL